MKLPFNIPVVSFFGRYWLLLLVFAAFFAASLNDWLFQKCGAILYAPALAAVALLIVALLRNVFYSKTLDEDIRTERFHGWWETAITPAEKVRWILGVTVGFFLGVCWIIAALAK